MVYRTGNSSDPTGWRAYHMKDFLIFACIGNTRNLYYFQVFVFIVMMVYRTGNSSDPIGWGAYHNMAAFGIFTCIGNIRNKKI